MVVRGLGPSHYVALSAHAQVRVFPASVAREHGRGNKEGGSIRSAHNGEVGAHRLHHMIRRKRAYSRFTCLNLQGDVADAEAIV